jgi:tetratricopeptide (TPR) repeat protein
VLEALRNHADAIVSYDRAISIDPGVAPVWFNRGNALLALGRADEAVESYDRALALDPSFALAEKNRKIASEKKVKKS